MTAITVMKLSVIGLANKATTKERGKEMAYGRPLTASEWKKVVNELNHNRIAHLPDGSGDKIIPWVGTHGTTYELRSGNGNSLMTTWDLDRIKKIVLQ